MSVHNLPPTPFFRDERADSPISEVALRVVVERPRWDLSVIGTATVIAPHLAITARHILQDIITTFGATALSVNSAVIDKAAAHTTIETCFNFKTGKWQHDAV